ncbi:hypothetical protein HKX48_001870, partial [Thoreauomyces humboldtii]
SGNLQDELLETPKPPSKDTLPTPGERAAALFGLRPLSPGLWAGTRQSHKRSPIPTASDILPPPKNRTTTTVPPPILIRNELYGKPNSKDSFVPQPIAHLKELYGDPARLPKFGPKQKKYNRPDEIGDGLRYEGVTLSVEFVEDENGWWDGGGCPVLGRWEDSDWGWVAIFLLNRHVSPGDFLPPRTFSSRCLFEQYTHCIIVYSSSPLSLLLVFSTAAIEYDSLNATITTTTIVAGTAGRPLPPLPPHCLMEGL